MDKGVNIQVVARCSAQEKAHGTKSVINIDQKDHTVQIECQQPGKLMHKTFTFDETFDPSATQEEVYSLTVSPIVEEVLKGFNCTIFAYGQTGTGKTFTMEGSRSRDESGKCDVNAGVIPRAIQQIFDTLERDNCDASVKVSFLELYNEELIDLLASEKQQLKIFDNGMQGVTVSPLEEVNVISAEDIYQVLDRAIQRRHVAETLLNAFSSRSHCIFSITIHMKETTPDGEDLIKIGKLNLVDLAGSENIGRSGATQTRATEAGNINKSLLTLGRVITELVQRSPHVPYRESKLTRLLQDSLGGRTKTCLIATISPSSVCLEETLSTLDYAFRAKKIKNRPQVNQVMTKRAMIREYTETIAKLKAELCATREKNGIYLPPERFNAMEREVAEKATEIASLKEQLETLTKERATDEERFKQQLDAEVQKRLEQQEAFEKMQLEALESLRANVSAFQETKQQEIADITEKVKALSATEQSYQTSATASMDGIQQRLREQSNELDNFSATSKKSAENMAAAVVAHVASQQTAVQQLKSAAAQASTEVRESLAEQKESLVAFADKQQQQLVAARDQMMLQMQQLLHMFVEQQQQSMQAAVDDMSGALARQCESVEQSEKMLQSQAESIGNSEALFATAMAVQFEEQQNTVAQSSEKCKMFGSQVTQHCSSMQKTWESTATQLAQEQDDVSDALNRAQSGIIDSMATWVDQVAQKLHVDDKENSATAPVAKRFPSAEVDAESRVPLQQRAINMR